MSYLLTYLLELKPTTTGLTSLMSSQLQHAGLDFINVHETTNSYSHNYTLDFACERRRGTLCCIWIMTYRIFPHIKWFTCKLTIQPNLPRPLDQSCHSDTSMHQVSQSSVTSGSPRPTAIYISWPCWDGDRMLKCCNSHVTCYILNKAYISPVSK